MSKLPPAPQLARECHGHSYAAVARRYGVTREAVRITLKKHGLSVPRRPRVAGCDAQKQISTTLALIAQGITKYRDLMPLLGYKSPSGVFSFIDKLIAQDLVVKDDLGQLSLTIAGEQFHRVPTTVVRRRADGAFEPITPGVSQ